MPVNYPSRLPPLSDNAPIALIYPYAPENLLVIHKDAIISQEQFLVDLHKVAAQLPNVKYALNLCEDRYYFLLIFCALMMKSAINLLPPNRHTNTLKELAEDYPDCYCIFDSAQPCDLMSLNVNELLQKNTSEKVTTLPLIPAQQIAAIAFTSGSTGKPKPNKKAWGTLAATARLLGQRITAHRESPVIVATVPPQHMYGLESTLMMALQTGAIMHSAKPFYPADIQTLLLDLNSPCILLTTPTHLRAVTQAELVMPKLSAIISATAPLDSAIALASEDYFNAPLWEIYGCTEAGAIATRRSTQTEYWQLLEGFSLHIDAEKISASAPHLNEVAPIQDQLKIADNGEFLLEGRNSDMINVAGKRSSLAYLTLQLLRIEGVDDGIIFLPPSSSHQMERRPVALVISQLSEKDILTALALRIESVFLPRPLRKVSHLPRNETGKLTASVLNELWNQ